MSTVFCKRYLHISWGDYTWSIRKFRFTHQKRARNFYLQVGSLEIVLWYR